MTLDEMYKHVGILLDKGSVTLCDTPRVHAPWSQYDLEFRECEIALVDNFDLDDVEAIIPYESQLGMALCTTFLSSPLKLVQLPVTFDVVDSTLWIEVRPGAFIEKPIIGSFGLSDWTLDRDTALKCSIAKWKYVVEWLESHKGETVNDGGAKTCALCHVYINHDCQGCPVSERTGKRSCEGTPFREYQSRRWGSGALQAARAELKFLESLV